MSTPFNVPEGKKDGRTLSEAKEVAGQWLVTVQSTRSTRGAACANIPGEIFAGRSYA